VGVEVKFGGKFGVCAKREMHPRDLPRLVRRTNENLHLKTANVVPAVHGINITIVLVLRVRGTLV
jgi:hypothetical protein